MTTHATVDHGRTLLQRAQWAARTFAEYDRRRVEQIVHAVAKAAHDHARAFAEAAVRETGFGVVADKVLKNETYSRGFVDAYGELDLCSHRIDPATRMLLVPRPAGVVLALTPSTSPVAALYFKVLSALLTRNAIVVSPHPAAREVSVEAARLLGCVASEAGAPDGAVQVVEDPTVPLIEAMMADERVDLILATGGSPMVRAAYRSGTPAIGVGPGNPPVLVDGTADLERAAESIVASKAFDNSVLCTAESLLLMVEPIAARLTSLLRQKGAHLCSDVETAKVRDLAYPGGKFDPSVVGRTARELAERAGIAVPAQTKLLLTPIDHVVPEEPLTHEKLCPVLAVRVVPDVERGIREAKALLRIVGAGHSAVIHSAAPQNVLDFSLAMPVHRMTVNAPGSLGNAGIGTSLPMTMSVGTGFVGGSSSGDNLGPTQLVQWNRIAYPDELAVPFPEFDTIESRTTFVRGERVPAYPIPSNAAGSTLAGSQALPIPADSGLDALREDLRRIVLEELRDLIGAR